MRGLLIAVAACLAVGCASGPKKEEFDALQARLADLEKKVGEMSQLKEDSRKLVDETKKLATQWQELKRDSDDKLVKVNQVLAVSMEVQERALKEQLSTCQNLIKELRKAPK